ncbi:MAG: carboxypeptidase-like regulatory domain-containing protein [Candidatus Acidiferrum sp.]
MIITLIEKERHGIMPPASAHQHDCRILETKDHRIRIKLDRTMDTRPGLFTILFLLIFSGLTCAAALAQQSFGSSSDKDLPDAPQPAGITSSSGETDSQQGTGTISGTVLDTNRDVFQGARVTAAGQSGSAIRILESGSNGQFAFAGLPPDTYQLTVTAPGMNSFTSSVISVHGGETRLVSVTLSVFGGTSSVTVSGNKEELAEEQVQIAVGQRLGGIMPNFYSSYNWNAPPMRAKQKFRLSIRSIVDPVSLFTAAGMAGVQQYRNTFPAYGGGIEGYGKRYGANLADDVTGILLSKGVYPSIFHQDPRYFYKGTGSIRSRMLYAISAAVIARGDDGRWKPNYSQVLGTFSAAGISNLYYPASDRGASLVLFNTLAGTGQSALKNLLREFVFKGVTSHVRREANGQP